MNKEEIKELEQYLKSLPKISNNMSIPITTNIGINMDDLMNAVKEFKKVPTYDELLRENKKLKKQLQQRDNIINKVSNYIDKFIPIDEDTILMRIRQRDYIIELLNTDKGDE